MDTSDSESTESTGSARNGPPRIPHHPLKMWTSAHVLTTRSFPSTSTLRRNRTYSCKGKHTCHCSETDLHGHLFDYLRLVAGPHLRGGGELPETKVCWNAENIWECRLPRYLTGMQRRVTFKELPTLWDGIKVLRKGTYWGQRLFYGRNGKRMTRHGCALIRLLGGENTYHNRGPLQDLLRGPILESRVNVLRNILATIDGLIMQLILAQPDNPEAHSWERIDQIILCLLTQLIADYFREGNLDKLTTFEKVKRLRKAIKEEGFKDNGDLGNLEVPQELSFFRAILERIGSKKTPLDLYRIGIMSQTRAAGVPPLSVYLKTQEKIRTLLTEPEDDQSFERSKPYIHLGVKHLHNEVVEVRSEEQKTALFKKCSEKAKVSLSDSGEFFTTCEQGGKLEAARKILTTTPWVPEIDLNTGQRTGRKIRPESGNQGEFLFMWACNMFHDRRSCYDRNVMSVRVHLVAELGKYRAITVSHLAHSTLLHVISHVMLSYLSYIPSSSSGVQAANHAWNFFKRLSHKNPSANFVFGDEDTYLYSTDWETATDYLSHKTSAMMFNLICRELGIPEWYRQTCNFALFAPRQVEARDRENNDVLYRYFTTRGVLMGDPVTKVVLHLYHLVAKHGSLAQIEHIRSVNLRASSS
jgi:hypothetical protein